MRPDRQYQGLQQETTLVGTMPDTDVGIDPNRFEGSFSNSELLDRADDSSSQRHAQRSWVFDRDGSLTNHHCTKKTGKKRAFWSTIWSEKASSQMDETVWMATDPSGQLLGSGEVPLVDTPKPAADSAQSLAGESNDSPSKNVAKDVAKLLIEDDDSNCPLTESDKSGEKIVRSRSSSMCSSGSCSGMGIFSREHVVSRSQLLLQYVDHLESISWDDDRSSVLGVLLEMITAVNHHVSCVDESISCHDQEEYANLQAEIRREKSQIKALVKELFGELPDAELGHLLLFQLDQ